MCCLFSVSNVIILDGITGGPLSSHNALAPSRGPWDAGTAASKRKGERLGLADKDVDLSV